MEDTAACHHGIIHAGHAVLYRYRSPHLSCLCRWPTLTRKQAAQ